MKKFSQFEPDEDAPLLLSLHRGDLSAFETLIWKYQKRVFNLAMLLTGVQSTACKVVENTFVTAFHNIKSLKSTVRFSSWLFSLALKECRELDDRQEPGFISDIDEDFSNEENYSVAVHKKMKLCIRQLPFELGELIVLRYVRGLRLDRINEIVQVGEGLLLTRLFEAQETLSCWLRNDMENLAESCGMNPAGSAHHPEIRRNFSAYLDNSVEGDEKELTKAHLKSCGRCREALAELEWMVEDIKGIPDVEPPLWIAATIMQKAKSPPDKPVEVKPRSDLKVQLAVVTILLSAMAMSTYLLLKSPETVKEARSAAPLPANKREAVPARVDDLTTIIKGVFRGSVSAQSRQSEGQPAARPSLPLAAPAPAKPLIEVAPVVRPVPLAATLREEVVQKKEQPETPPSILQEWGDSAPQNRAPQKNIQPARLKSGDTEIVLGTVKSPSDIESAITSAGGRINGRGYSSGADILYISIEVDSFFDLLSRLGKAGKIQALPQIPEGTQGSVDLTVKWQ
jgi:RNA polymerase sigma-70 factor (ECF subfamily)